MSLSIIDRGMAIADPLGRLAALGASVRTRAAATPAEERALAETLELAEARWQARQFVLPLGDSALDAYRRVLQLDPQNAPARARLRQLSNYFVEASRRALDTDDFPNAIAFAEQGLLIDPQNDQLRALSEQLASIDTSRR